MPSIHRGGNRSREGKYLALIYKDYALISLCTFAIKARPEKLPEGKMGTKGCWPAEDSSE